MSVAAGALLLLGSLPGTGTFDWPTEALAPGAALAASGMAGLIALYGVQTYRDRQADRIDAATRDNRARAYEQILAHVVSSFTPHGAPYDREALVRGMAASWSSAETSIAYSDWVRYSSAYTGKPNEVPKAHSFEIVWRLIRAMRSDIDPGNRVPKHAVMATLFNDYDPEVHSPSGIDRLVVPRDGVAYIPQKS